MAISTEEPLAQRMLKALDEHGEALNKMGGRLTRLEESKLKKSTHVEIHDDEEWDEKDKVEYERHKQFEKLTAKTIAMREKMEKMQLVFYKAQGMDNSLYNMGGNLSCGDQGASLPRNLSCGNQGASLPRSEWKVKSVGDETRPIGEGGEPIGHEQVVNKEPPVN
ncbi:hypothetical protein SO802_026081 [Lithocarpus litseifolius]|uniref:Uncharacterized protein n=1 Tax=Lithocarpus litseifolius TaxID=425828 RepID=A0AAW2BYK9_9ROSI